MLPSVDKGEHVLVALSLLFLKDNENISAVKQHEVSDI